MTKPLSFTILFFVACFCSCAQQYVADTTAKRLGIKSIVRQTGDSLIPYKYTELYSPQGKIAERTTINIKLNKIVSHEDYFYNNRGKLTRIEFKRYDNEDSTSGIYSLRYGMPGKLKKTVNSDIRSLRTVSGKTVLESYYYRSITLCKYNNRSRLVRSVEKAIEIDEPKKYFYLNGAFPFLILCSV